MQSRQAQHRDKRRALLAHIVKICTETVPLWLALTAAGCTLLLAACATDVGRPGAGKQPTDARAKPAASSTPGRTPARVVGVIDGDTIKVDIAGRVYKVRYIGINAPELDQPMGGESRTANEQLVAARTVYLEKDVSETDQYGRLLRYVYLADGTFVNAELVRDGYAQALRYEPDVRRQDTLEQVEQEARRARRGVWKVMATASAGTGVRIIAVDKSAEYVVIHNAGVKAQDLSGWVLVSEKGGQRCRVEEAVLEAGASLRMWAMAEDEGQGGYNCGFDETIWSNSEPDPAALYDAAGQLVDRYP